jgi:type VI secretion system protein ImpC
MLEAAARCEALSLSHPQAARLALLCCLPVRVTPALVRMVRLRLLPQASTGDEADLWLSDLVDTRSSGGFAFEPSVRSHLRDQLAAQPALLDELWHRVHVEHGTWLSARARLEEEMTWRLLRDPADPWIGQQWQAVIDEMDQSDAPEGLARWVVRAMNDLPPGSRQHPAGERIWLGAHLLLGDVSVLGKQVQHFLDTQAFNFALRRLPRRTVHVARTEHGVLISPLQPIENGFVVEVPATKPIWVQIEPADGAPLFEPEAVLVHELETQHVTVGAETVNLRWLDGAVQALGPQQDTKEPFAARNRSPRVRITYDVEAGDHIQQIELPFVMGVLADLSGMPGEPLPPVADRKFMEIDVDNFDARMRAFKPRVAFMFKNPPINDTIMQVDLTFESMDSFSPDRFALQVEPLRAMVLAREGLSKLLSCLSDQAEAQAWLNDELRRPGFIQKLNASDKMAAAYRRRWVEQLMRHNLSGASKTLTEPIDSGLKTLVQLTASQPFAQEHNLLQHVQSLMDWIDAQLHEPLNEILHHPAFQKLESAWRGLHHLVHNTETNDQLKIKVMNIRKDELREALPDYQSEHWDRSTLYQKAFKEEFVQLGGEPYGCLLGDFEFDQSTEDLLLLHGLGMLASFGQSVLLSNVSPRLLHMETWQELGRPRDLHKVMETSEHALWEELRRSPVARHLGLCMPRMLARQPYGARTHPLDTFAFEESTANQAHLCWIGSAYGMATNLGKAFTQSGWLARIRGVENGGALMQIPTWVGHTDDGEIEPRCATEIAITDRREKELSELGLMPLVHVKNTDFAVFFSARSLHQAEMPIEQDLATDTALYDSLPGVFVINRITQYLMCLMRDKIGAFRSADDAARYLNNWLQQYIDPTPDTSDEHFKALRPLAWAHVRIGEDRDNAGWYPAEMEIQPHFQLEGLSAPTRVEFRLPSAR